LEAKRIKIKKILLYPFKVIISIARMNLKTKIGISLLAIFIAISLLEPAINYYRLNGKSPLEIGEHSGYLLPSYSLPLGTDPYGRDMFALLLMGTRYTLTIGFVAGIIDILIALTIGFLAGYKGGLVDHALRSITDALLVIPTWPLVIFLTLYLKQMDILNLSLIIGIFGWPGVTRLLRSQVLSVKERPYIELAKLSGENDLEVIFKEIAPNVLPYIGVGFAEAILAAMMIETGFRMLIGVGPINLVTLGYLVKLAISQGFLTTRLYAIIPPILFLVLIFVSLNLINIGLDEAYNPRLKKITGI
jgi:peptide/nickel transport system permease protein